MKIKDIKIEHLFTLAKILLPAFIKAHKNVLGGRAGIYLAVRIINGKIEEPIEGKIIGQLTKEKVTEKQGFAEEKIKRMISESNFCSFQSENEDEKQFGGGIRGTYYYIAPSGFPPHLDQKFALLLAITAGEIRAKRYVEIMEVSYDKVNYWRAKNNETHISLSEL